MWQPNETWRREERKIRRGKQTGMSWRELAKRRQEVIWCRETETEDERGAVNGHLVPCYRQDLHS